MQIVLKDAYKAKNKADFLLIYVNNLG